MTVHLHALREEHRSEELSLKTDRTIHKEGLEIDLTSGKESVRFEATPVFRRAIYPCAKGKRTGDNGGEAGSHFEWSTAAGYGGQR